MEPLATRLALVHDPDPLDNVAVQRETEPPEAGVALKVTLPVGVPEYSGDTLALKVTVSPDTSLPDVGDMEIEVVVEAWFTT